MPLVEEDFLKLVAGAYGRELLKRYRKNLAPIFGHDIQQLPSHDKLSAYAQELFQVIASGAYSPKPPLDYLVVNKHNGVPRILPIFNFDDALVYFFCVYSVQEELVKGRTDGTFGGWRSGNSFRKVEESGDGSTEGDTEMYAPYANVNRPAWSKHWKDFQAKAFAISKQGENHYIVKYDVANFYDSVNLNHLEQRLRHTCGTAHRETIDLLMTFLSRWNRGIEGYIDKQVGLPMDVEGEASRLLANFYLQEHDRKVSLFVQSELGGKYLRYADDILILVSRMSDRSSGLVKSGIELHRSGLSINSGKVYTFDKFEDYDHYWAFDLFEMIGDGNDSTWIDAAAVSYLERIAKGSCGSDSRPWRHESVLKRLINVGRNMSEANRKRVLETALQRETLSRMDTSYLRRIHSLLPASEQDWLIDSIYEIAEKSSYTQQLLYARDFLTSLSSQRNVASVNQRIKELSAFYGFRPI